MSLIARSFAAGEMSGPLTQGKLMVKNYCHHNAHVSLLLETSTNFEFLSTLNQLRYPISGLAHEYGCVTTVTQVRRTLSYYFDNSPTDIAMQR